MKKTSLLLCFILLISLVGCSVVHDLPDSVNARYFAYNDGVEGTSNAVMLSESDSSRDLERKIIKSLEKNKLPIIPIQSLFFENGEKIPEFDLVYNNFKYTFNLYQHKICALYISDASANGYSELVSMLAKDCPMLKIIEGLSTAENLDKNKVDEVWLEVGEDVAAAYEAAQENAHVVGLVCNEKSSISEKVGEKIVAKGGIDFEKMKESTCKNFGYYASSNETIEEVGKLGNTNVIVLGPCDIKTFEERMNICEKYSMSPLVNVGAIFADWNGDLSGDWEANYAIWKPVFTKYREQILSFYVDEPVLNGVKQAVFRFYTKLLREDFPDIKMKATLALPTLKKGTAEYFEYCTDLSYDTYKIWDKNERLNELHQLMDIAAYGQDLWLIGWSFVGTNGANNEGALVKDIQESYALAKKYDRIIGILEFVYDNADTGGDWGTGFRGLSTPENPLYMPKLVSEHIRIGKEISKTNA